MGKTPRRLGRGLDSLVTDFRAQPTQMKNRRDPAASEPGSGLDPQPTPSMGKTEIAISALKPNPFQPRRLFDPNDLEALATSISRSGMLQPIIVRERLGSYEIIAGERRWRAAKQCGMTTVPIVVRKANDEQMVELALIENIQREDLNPIDRATAYRSFCERFDLKADDVAERLGEDRSTVANYMRLLELPSDIRGLVAAGQLSMGHARCLLGVANDDRRNQLADSAARHELSVRALEDIVRREKSKSREVGAGTSKEPLRSPHLRELQARFEQALHTKVTIQEGKRKGTVRIVIQYFSLDDFDRVADRLGVAVES